MNESLLITEILKETFPLECEVVGPANLKDITKGEVDFISAEHGSYMDLKDAIVILAAATTIIKNAIEIYGDINKKKLEHPPEKDEIEDRIFSKKENSPRLDKETRDRLLKIIIQKFKPPIKQ